MAGPLSPPTTLEIFGRRVSTSMTIARNVLTSDTASAPASSAARANDAMSVTFGVSFGNIGSRVTLRTALTTSKVPPRLHPNVMPPSLMFGQEMFSSRAATPSASVAPQVASERGAAFFDFRAGVVQPQARHSLGVGQHSSQLDVLVDSGP